MTTEIEGFIAQNCIWAKLPLDIKQLLGNSEKEYEKQVVEYSVKTQLRYRDNIVRHIVKNQRSYYEEVLSYSRTHLMMFPYHLSDVVVKGLRMTPFQYYISILTDIMEGEKSYDSLPNFTAADCLRLLGIGRNQYIDLMNQCRSSRKLFRRKSVRDLLPQLPLEITIEPWWKICVGCVTEDDIKCVKQQDKVVIDKLIDSGPQLSGKFEKQITQSLYAKGLVYLEVPINGTDRLGVPPLEGFVMNRVLGDYLESLMYKIFVSIDEHTPVQELATVLEIDLALVKVAVSLFCRLGFAQRKTGTGDIPAEGYHASWNTLPTNKVVATTEDLLLLELESALAEITGQDGNIDDAPITPMGEDPFNAFTSSAGQGKRIGFLYDSTLTAFLMMGNLSPGLKCHAVTMFEVGKMLDEGLDSLISELDNIQRSDCEGEAQRYFEHAVTLRTTIAFLRHNPDLLGSDNQLPLGLDLIRWESLSNLDPATTARLLNKNYQFLVSMAPLSYEICSVEGEMPPHFGPSIPEVNSIWFKMFLYDLTGSGPPSLLLPKGERLRRLPSCLTGYEKVLVTPWGHDPTVVPLPALFATVNEALMHSPVFIQAYGWYHDVCIQHIPLPLHDAGIWTSHPAVKCLVEELDLRYSFGFIKLVAFPAVDSSMADNHNGLTTAEINTGVPGGSILTQSTADVEVITPIPSSTLQEKCNDPYSTTRSKVNDGRDGLHLPLSGNNNTMPPMEHWHLLECHFGLPLFDAKLNNLISSRIISHNLFKAENVEKFSLSCDSLVLRLKEFILCHKARTCSVDLHHSRRSRDGTSSLPLPTTSLLFNAGTLVPWDGS